MKTTTLPKRMNWELLLCSKRVSEFSSCEITPKISNYEEVRSPFEKDFDQLIYSYPFRRLQDKTQVIPFPEFDFVHTRLTHSLEVASVGRSLGKMAAEKIFEELGKSKMEELGLTKNDIGTLVAAACLAHDIGNPPFGHSGESSISLYFKQNEDQYQNAVMPVVAELNSEDAGHFPAANYTVYRNYFVEREQIKQWTDLINFEGNANGFRIITRNCEKGINPTAALLGTFTKYPRESFIPSMGLLGTIPKSLSKYGFFQSEKDIFRELANELGLILRPEMLGGDLAYSRHPLAFLMEASDDIAYGIIDFEDGCRLKLIDFHKFYGIIKVRNKKGKMEQKAIESTPIDLLIEIAKMDTSYDETKDVHSIEFKEALAYLRSKVINVLTHECYGIYLTHYEEIMAGTFSKSLIDNIIDPRIKNGIDKMNFLVRKYVYNYPPVLQSEASGFEVMSYLIRAFAMTSNICITCGEEPDEQAVKLRSLLPEEYSPHEEEQSTNLTPAEVYKRLLQVLDYVSGMTDNYAMSLYRKITGISHH